MISFCLNHCTKTASVKITNGLHVAKYNGQFLVLMLCDLSVPSKKVVLPCAPGNPHLFPGSPPSSLATISRSSLLAHPHHIKSKLTSTQSLDLSRLHLHPHQCPGFSSHADDS